MGLPIPRLRHRVAGWRPAPGTVRFGRDGHVMMVMAAIAYVLPLGRPSDRQTERGTTSVQLRSARETARSAA